MEDRNRSQENELWAIGVDAALARFDATCQGLAEAEARQRLWKRQTKPGAPSPSL